MPLAIPFPVSQVANDSSKSSRVRIPLRSTDDPGLSSKQQTMHCTMEPSSKTSCMMKPPSPTQPYSLGSWNSSAPSLSFTFSMGTRRRESRQPAATALDAGSCSPSTCRRTKPKIPSAPIRAPTWGVEPCPKIFC
jgi:hypothetical protein